MLREAARSGDAQLVERPTGLRSGTIRVMALPTKQWTDRNGPVPVPAHVPQTAPASALDALAGLAGDTREM